MGISRGVVYSIIVLCGFSLLLQPTNFVAAETQDWIDQYVTKQTDLLQQIIVTQENIGDPQQIVQTIYEYEQAPYRGLPNSIYTLFTDDGFIGEPEGCDNLVGNGMVLDEFKIVEGGYPLYDKVKKADFIEIDRPDGLIFSYNVTNFVDSLELKQIRLYVTYCGPDAVNTLEVLGFDNTIQTKGISGKLIAHYDVLSDTKSAISYFEDWEITPNPDWEQINIFSPTNSIPIKIEIDTISTDSAIELVPPRLAPPPPQITSIEIIDMTLDFPDPNYMDSEGHSRFLVELTTSNPDSKSYNGIVDLTSPSGNTAVEFQTVMIQPGVHTQQVMLFVLAEDDYGEFTATLVLEDDLKLVTLDGMSDAVFEIKDPYQ